MTLVSASAINFLNHFFTEAEINLIISDVNNLELYFPLDDKKNPKNYLNILVNVFMKYRVECVDVTELSSHHLLSLGKDFTSKVVSDISSSFELLEFTYKPISDLQKLLDPQFKQFFQSISASFPDLPVVDITSQDSIDYNLNHTLSSDNQNKDYGFASYLNLNYLEDSEKGLFPKKISNKILSESIEKCLRYYAYDMIFKSWNYTFKTIFNKDFELSSVSEAKKTYFILEWFFTGTHENRSFYHLQTTANFREWIEYCRSGMFNTFDKNISYKIQFNDVFVEKIKKLLSLVTQKPFCRTSNCISPVLNEILDYFINHNPISDIARINSHELIQEYYEHIEQLFQFFSMSFEAERFLLQANQFIDLIINHIVLETTDSKRLLSFPYKLLWKSKSDDKSALFSTSNLTDTDKEFINFLTEFVHSKNLTKNNFTDYSSQIEQLRLVQEKLIIIGDFSNKEKIELPDTKELLTKNDPYSVEELQQLASVDRNVRRVLGRCKNFWYKIVLSNPLYQSDPVFKETFDTAEKKETFAINSQLEIYFTKWNEYKSKSTVISNLEEEIEIVSKLKYNIEGLRLLTRKFSGAMSFINGKALMEKEKSRLIDAILKDLVGTQLSFHYNEGITSKLELIQLSTDEEIISSAIEVVEETQSFKKQILAILQPLPVIQTVELFIQNAKILLGNTFKTIQITRFLENYNKWIIRLEEESQLLVVGLHIKNFNEFLISLFGTISNTIDQISRFYKSSLSKEALQKISLILSTKHMGKFMSTLVDLNVLLLSLIDDLTKQLVHLPLYSEKLTEITEEVFSSYSQLINTDDVIRALKSIKIKHTYDKEILTILEKVTDKESLLKKQLFIEKAFRLSLLLNSVFVLIERKLNEEYKPLIINSTYINLEEVGENVSLKDRIEIIRTILENIIEFLKSIKILSRRHTQVLKIIIYYAPILVDRLNIKDLVKSRVFSILQLINNYNRHIKDFSILKSLNEELITFNNQINASFNDFLKIYISEQSDRKEIGNLITLEDREPIYSRNFLLWAKKIQLAVVTVSTESNIEAMIPKITDQFKNINLDRVQEEILDIFVSRKEEEKLVFKKKEKVKKVAVERERSYQEEISALKEKVRLLEEQVKLLQEENQRLKELPQLERPEVIEAKELPEVEEVQEPEIVEEPKPRLTEISQEKLPFEEIRVKKNLEKVSIFSTKINRDALVPAKSADEVNPDVIIKIDPRPTLEEDELASLPEYDLIKELRKVGQLKFMPLFKDVSTDPGADLITEIESLIETQQVLGAATSRPRIQPVRTENEELAEEIAEEDAKVYKKEPESIFSFNLEEKIIPETTFRFKSPSELVKFADGKEKKPQEKSLDTMKSLKEEIAEYDETPSALELKINAYAKELFGEDEDDDSKVKNTSKGPKNEAFDLVNEMEDLLDPNKTKKQKNKSKS